MTWQELDLYGSARLGIAKPEREMTGFFWQSGSYTLVAGAKSYELSNHLGNVLAVVSDRGELQSAQDYFPFGMAMPGRSTGAYRYGFNGKETDPETGLNDFGARLYDNRLGRWLAVDPLAKKYPALTPYNFVANMPLIAIDPNGKEIVILITDPDKPAGKPLTIVYRNGKLFVQSLEDYKSGRKGDNTIKQRQVESPYEGKDKFALQVRDELNLLKAGDPILAGRLSTLEAVENKHRHIIEETDEENENSAMSLNGSKTLYNPTSEKGFDGDRSPLCALAHELLSHGWEADQNNAPEGRLPNGIPLEEVNGVNIENIARAIARKAAPDKPNLNQPRTHYSKISKDGKTVEEKREIPADRLVTPKK